MVSLRNLFSMGSSQSKDERKTSRPGPLQQTSGQITSGEPSPSYPPTPGGRLAERIYTQHNGGARGSRPDLSFLHIGRSDRANDASQPERPRETKQEREARRAERERQARLRERERSMREESVDGGYLVTVGVYTGPEDFSKPVVRQLQIERRLAPFWRGLNDHQDSWTEAQLVAAARGLPIPAPDEIPIDMARTASQASFDPRASDGNLNSLTVPITGRSQSYQSDTSNSLSASHPAFSSSSGHSTPTALNANNPLFRGRAKTLASTLTGKLQSSDASPQEIVLPRNPYINGQPVEAYLYKDVDECPICFMYYPPYLNRTRCCDQPICSECFVQIKRPDPHPPEHEQPGQPKSPEEEAETLVSEVAACPFCVRPEFGITYEPPPFRRGLAYAHLHSGVLKSSNSPISSPASLGAPSNGRRRGISLSADSSQVITTDRVRPDWAKKLADARAHALRRSAAATALHNAAYVLGNQGDTTVHSSLLIARRRRGLFGDSPTASGSGTPREGNSNVDIAPGRGSSRRPRVEDLEELMMMEAIRLSLAAEDERKRKEDKEAAKEQKKKAKADKKADKVAKKNAGKDHMYRADTNESSSTWMSTSMGRSTSNLGQHASIPEEDVQGKGKQPVHDFAGFNPSSEPTSALHRDTLPSLPTLSTSAAGDAQRHLEESRAHLQPSAAAQMPIPGQRSTHVRQLSETSSLASSFVDSLGPESSRGASNLTSNHGSGVDITTRTQQDGSNVSSAAGTPAASTLEPMLNFRSLTAMMNEDEKHATGNDHLEHAEPTTQAEEQLKEPSPTGSPHLAPAMPTTAFDTNRSRGNSGESSNSAPPRAILENTSQERHLDVGGPNEEKSVVNAKDTPSATVTMLDNPNVKEAGTIDVADQIHEQDVPK